MTSRTSMPELRAEGGGTSFAWTPDLDTAVVHDAMRHRLIARRLITAIAAASIVA